MNCPHVLLFGCSGLIGSEIARALSGSYQVIGLNAQNCSFLNLENIRQAIQQHQPQFIINAAAYTNVNEAEFNLSQVYCINTQALKIISEEAMLIDATLIHFSTDYVFDGSLNKPYHENDLPNPINIYGVTKYLSEKIIEAHLKKYIILRTSWVFGHHPKTFLEKILAALKANQSISIQHPFYGIPTSAAWLGLVVRSMLDRLCTDHKSVYGIYHASHHDVTTWFDYATFIQETYACHYPSHRFVSIEPCSSENTIKRPFYSALCSKKLETIFKIQNYSWKHAVTSYIQEYWHEKK